MDVERTKALILKRRSEFWAAMKAAEARADRADKRMDRAEARTDRFDPSLDSIPKQFQYCAKLQAQVRQAQRETRKTLRELAASQKITGSKLQDFLDSLRKSANRRRRG